MSKLRTDRLLLRGWRPEDLDPFAELNADREVMRHYPAPLDREQSDALAEQSGRSIAGRGWGLWAVEVVDGAPFIGFVGLAVPGFDAPFMPAVEVGWRLARPFWGRGYATEAARAAVAYGFDELALDEIVSFTTGANERSQRVMERLAMRRDPTGDFEHPRMPVGHRLRPHLLYRLPR